MARMNRTTAGMASTIGRPDREARAVVDEIAGGERPQQRHRHGHRKTEQRQARHAGKARCRRRGRGRHAASSRRAGSRRRTSATATARVMISPTTKLALSLLKITVEMKKVAKATTKVRLSSQPNGGAQRGRHHAAITSRPHGPVKKKLEKASRKPWRSNTVSGRPSCRWNRPK